MTTLLLRCLATSALLLVLLPPAWPDQIPLPQAAKPPTDLTELSPGELAQLEVTTVSRRPEKRSRAAAAVHVITQEDIHRSGVRTLADALRLAPGIQVARINASQWAVGARGFASRLSRSMLVLMDGRSVYTPLFAGVYWEVQDTLLEDVERIEVIRGPGGTLWGANAVNGVVNIVTRSSRSTQGLVARAGAGSPERGFAGLRYGGRLGDGASYRAYAKYFDRGPAFHPDGRNFDAWSMGQGGFRADWERDPDRTLTVQGDLYGGRTGERTSLTTYAPPFTQTVEEDGKLSGGNLLGRWQRRLSSDRDLSFQAYLDRTVRNEPNFEESRHTLDLDLQHHTSLGPHQHLLVGLGYRLSRGATSAIPTVAFDPPTRTDHLASGFVQDEIDLSAEKLHLTLGAKLEHNDYSGFEVQPGVRVLWEPAAGHSLWGAVARAVRTPTRLEHDLALTALIDPRGPIFARVLGNQAFRSEKAIVYEAGYRAQTSQRVAFDLAAFYNRYTDLSSIETGTPFRETTPAPSHTILPFVFANQLEGKGYGAELTADAALTTWVRLLASYSLLRLDLEARPGSTDTTSQSAEGASPRHQAVARSSVSLPGGLVLDTILRYVSALPTQRVPGYTSLDSRLAWQATKRIELALVGQNLLAAHHLEFGGTSAARTEVRRGLYGQVTFRQ